MNRMDGWMNRWIDEWMVACMIGWRDEWMLCDRDLGLRCFHFECELSTLVAMKWRCLPPFCLSLFRVKRCCVQQQPLMVGMMVLLIYSILGMSRSCWDFPYSYFCVFLKHIIAIPRQFNQVAIHMCSHRIKFYLDNIASFSLWPLCNPTMKLSWSPPPPFPHDCDPTIQ